MNNKEESKKLLVYYFKLLFNKTGANWESDNEIEIGEIIDCIFNEIWKQANK